MNALETLAYYDVLDYPMSKSELGEIPRHFSVKERDGLYFLFDKEYLVPLRKRREEFSISKLRTLLRTVRFLALVPFIRCVFLSGSLSMNNADEFSDFDIIVVAKSGHIWTARFFTAALLSLIGMRRKHGEHLAPNKICPNHFITDESLHIPFHSVYTAHLYSHLIPLVCADTELPKKFMEENRWVLEYVKKWEMDISHMRSTSILQKVAEIVFGSAWLEKKLGNYQRKRIESKTNVISPGGHLVYNDESLAFHLGSSEAEVIKKYRDNLTKLSLSTKI